MRQSALVLALMFGGAALAKNELIVDARRVQTQDLVTIAVVLEGPFATIEEPHVPLRNLRFVGEPAVSSEFAWLQGEVSRRKSFRFTVRPIAPGAAQIGPIVLEADGERDTLAAVTLEVLPDRITGSNDAEVVLRDLLAAGRAPLFIVAETDKKTAVVGEPILATWYLYNATVIRDWRIAAVPKLGEFWIEELPRGDNGERVYVGDLMMQRVPVRRALLFALHSGSVRVEGMTIEAAVLERTRGGPFAMFEGSVVDTTFTSAPFDVDVRPLPEGPIVDAIGDLALRCEAPAQRNAGPVIVRATLEGLANLRAATAPRFEGPVAGAVRVEGGQVTVESRDAGIAISRRWQFLVFPTKSGPLHLPALTMNTLVPATGERRTLRCEAATIGVTAAAPSPASDPKAPKPRVSLPWVAIAGALAALAALVFTAQRLRREIALRRDVREILHDASPAEVRARIQARMRIDPDELSDRGDAWRALLSLIDAIEHERDLPMDVERELRRRVREVLR